MKRKSKAERRLRRKKAAKQKLLSKIGGIPVKHVQSIEAAFPGAPKPPIEVGPSRSSAPEIPPPPTGVVFTPEQRQELERRRNPAVMPKRRLGARDEFGEDA
jgi:hypothetical protein